ncbi:MAG: glycosyltransferase [Methyloceanibacter sp.]|nr:glycosyltransferase [Methyloceanibacter sp.]
MLIAPSTQTRGSLIAPRAAGTPLSAAVEYSFLVNTHLSSAALAEACRLAERWGVPVHEAMIASGLITAEAYARALAASAGVPYRSRIAAPYVAPQGGAGPSQCLRDSLVQDLSPTRRILLDATQLRPLAVRALLAKLGTHPVALTTPGTLRNGIAACFASRIAQDAIWALKFRAPRLSAHRPLMPWQLWSIVLGALAFVAGALIALQATIYAASLASACLFLPIVVFRLQAVLTFTPCNLRSRREHSIRDADVTLPTYTILAPLYREAHMLKPLLHGLCNLDWPAAKLDIKLVLEATDAKTVAEARALHLPANVEIVVVPDLGPRTKPKALNYALPRARGEYLVVYDAEDIPEPDQLRCAYQAFRTGPPSLATAQARLNIHNSDANWLTRQFAIEYLALFDGLLPLLDRLKLPIPLGGTSNHFRVAALKRLLAWDPFNVTEDADLGARMSRLGYRCTVIASTTFEEAPVRLGSWIRQRTRWMKGFVQTWLVHMRHPSALFHQLGLRGFVAFQIMIGGTILTALLHPWFYVLLALQLVSGGTLLALPESVFGVPFWAASTFSLAVGYATAMTLGLIAVRHRRQDGLRWHVAFMPVYWLLVSFAAYRAVWQFIVAPFKWEKTDHGSRARARPAS